jgi:hypothetical protein
MNDDVDEIVDVSCVNWMMRWIDCMLRELHLSTCSEPSFLSSHCVEYNSKNKNKNGYHMSEINYFKFYIL